MLPIVALVLCSSPSELAAGVRHRLFAPAMLLSLRTTVVSLVCVVVAGTPLAWWLAAARRTLRAFLAAHLAERASLPSS